MVERASLPASLEVTAETPDGVVMGLQHTTHAIHGVQFHPESIASECGYDLLANFLTLAGLSPRRRNVRAAEAA
jgi:anthranilate synthase component 2